MNALIQLVEHKESDPITLSVEERDRITRLLPRATITPVPGSSDSYTINPRNAVGLVNTGETTIQIAPKIGIARALFLVTYALDPRAWKDHDVGAASDASLNEAIAIPFLRHAHNAVRRHVLHGYRSIDDSLHGIRGRVRFSDQLRRHQRLSVPVEVTYDEHTPDVIENQLLLAALDKLRRLGRLPDQLQHDLAQLTRTFADVTLQHFRPQTVPRPAINRLNSHYAPALTLARLILTNETLELDTGSQNSNGVLFDMANVFETFVHTALREELGLSERQFPRGRPPGGLYLDHARHVRLEPDISWWEQGACCLVGDVKYKRTTTGDGNNADLYQVLAYAKATQLDNATLIYASTEAETATHRTPDGTTLHVEALSLDGEPNEVLEEISEIAARLRERRAVRPLVAIA